MSEEISAHIAALRKKEIDRELNLIEQGLKLELFKFRLRFKTAEVAALATKGWTSLGRDIIKARQG